MAFRRAIDRLEGSFAVAAVFSGSEAVYATRNQSPLVLGIGEDGYHLASDVPAFLDHTDQVVYLQDDQFAKLCPSGVEITDKRETLVDMPVKTVEWDPEEAGKSGYDHYMLKEINEQPRAIRNCVRGRVDEMTGSVSIKELDDLDRPERIHLVACGTSYHASLYAALRGCFVTVAFRPRPSTRANMMRARYRSTRKRSSSALPKAARQPIRSVHFGLQITSVPRR